MSYIEMVKAIYAAYARADIPAILDRLATNVTFDSWSANAAQQAGVPWLQERRGKLEIQEFFDSAEDMDVRRLEIRCAWGGGNKVAVEVVFESANPPIRDEECHVWTFDDSGKVTSMRHYLDTAKHIAAAGLGESLQS